MAFRMERVIHAPVETVFGLLENPEQRKSWTEGLEETTYTHVPQDGSRVGTTFVERVREGGRITEYSGRLTAFEPNRLIAVEIGNRHFTMAIRYDLSENNGSCRILYSGEMQPHTLLGRMVGFLFGWLTRKIARKQLGNLTRVAESRS